MLVFFFFVQFLLAVLDVILVLLDLSLSVKAATLIISYLGVDLAISSAKEGKSGFIYNLIKSY